MNDRYKLHFRNYFMLLDYITSRGIHNRNFIILNEKKEALRNLIEAYA